MFHCFLPIRVSTQENVSSIFIALWSEDFVTVNSREIYCQKFSQQESTSRLKKFVDALKLWQFPQFFFSHRFSSKRFTSGGIVRHSSNRRNRCFGTERKPFSHLPLCFSDDTDFIFTVFSAMTHESWFMRRVFYAILRCHWGRDRIHML